MATLLLTAAGAAALIWSAWIHLYLWSGAYGSFSVGPLFISQGIVAIATALVLVATRRAAVAIFGAVLLVSTAFGLLLSHWFGLFGYYEPLGVPYAGMSLVVEFAGAATLGLAGDLLRYEQKQSP